jgi:hypothetical protein
VSEYIPSLTGNIYISQCQINITEFFAYVNDWVHEIVQKQTRLAAQRSQDIEEVDAE